MRPKLSHVVRLLLFLCASMVFFMFHIHIPLAMEQPPSPQRPGQGFGLPSQLKTPTRTSVPANTSQTIQRAHDHDNRHDANRIKNGGQGTRLPRMCPVSTHNRSCKSSMPQNACPRPMHWCLFDCAIRGTFNRRYLPPRAKYYCTCHVCALLCAMYGRSIKLLNARISGVRAVDVLIPKRANAPRDFTTFAIT